jgi:hypothetical protein
MFRRNVDLEILVKTATSSHFGWFSWLVCGDNPELIGEIVGMFPTCLLVWFGPMGWFTVLVRGWSGWDLEGLSVWWEGRG